MVSDAAADIVVTGFRASLNNALSQKRKETAAVDAIVAEDIGKFPDSNLAESMQRVPGVALARGDGGEGRNIAVRGLGAGFTRVRLNGMEATSQTATSNIYGTQNSARNFDFNAFPTEIFSALVVRKTPSADVEEGSLGATVDLLAPKPLDSKKDFVLTATARATYSELSEDLGPRASMLISKKFDDGRWGVLASLAYQQRKMREVGYNASDVISANTNGLFCTPLGYPTIYPLSASKGANAQNCSTGNPRTGTVAAYEAIANLRRPDAAAVPGSGAFFPRLPSYLNNTQDQERIGGTFTVLFQPDDDTDISVDLLYSRFNVSRLDTVIGALSFGRQISNNGQPMTSVRDVQFDEKGSLVYGVFDGVDLFSDSQQENFSSTFKQVNLNFKRKLTDTLEITGLFGLNQSYLDGTRRQHTYMNANDVDNFVLDFRDGGVPTIGLGIDPSDPNSFVYGPALADGTVRGSFDYQNRPATTVTNGLTAEFNASWRASEQFTILAGAQYRQSHYRATSSRPWTVDLLMEDLPAGMTLADITSSVNGLDKLWGHGAPASYLIIDPDKWAAVFDQTPPRFCQGDCGGGDTRIKEDVASTYLMSRFDLSDALGFGLRGDAGLRYVRTSTRSSGGIAVAAPAGNSSPTGLGVQYAAVSRTYDDWLPSANLVIEPVDNLVVRLAASKVMSRPDLGFLSPTSGVTATTRVGTVNNPFLDPIRATTYDAAIEWYFRPGSLLSVAYFRKEIKTFIQRVTNIVSFDTLGLPNELLLGTPAVPTDLFTVSQPVNTPGGPLNGVEVNLQMPLTFLPGMLKNFGILANYTHVQSKIEYLLTATNGGTTTADLVGASRNTASGTIYYEDDKFSIRSTLNWRDKFIRTIPASPGSNYQGNSPTIYVDASASYQLTDSVKLIVEAQNLTDEENRFFIDGSRNDTLYQTRVGRTISVGVNFQL
ncbi:TonB-dependent receptor [Sphingobium lactosutens]|nr:TonB-dependent receptor [Sphingobium lactosutens]